MSGAIRVLHIDDDPGFGELTATALEREDERFSVETVVSASAGLDRLGTTDYDCIVSDYDMPQTNGIDFLEAVRDEYPDLPFILFTGKGSEEVASEAIASGVTDYLQKESGTIQYTVLANRIDNAVTQYDAEQRAEARAHQLASKNQLLESLFDALPVGVIAEDASGGVLVVNDQYLDLWDISASREEVTDWTTDRILSLVREKLSDGEAFVERTRRLVEEDQPVDNEEIELAGGRMIARSHRPFDLPDGRGYVWIYRDITDRKQRERESQRHNPD